MIEPNRALRFVVGLRHLLSIAVTRLEEPDEEQSL
jgi:hypothetical protein